MTTFWDTAVTIRSYAMNSLQGESGQPVLLLAESSMDYRDLVLSGTAVAANTAISVPNGYPTTAPAGAGLPTVQVFLDGTELTPAQFTATNGSSISLVSPITANQRLVVRVLVPDQIEAGRDIVFGPVNGNYRKLKLDAEGRLIYNTTTGQPTFDERNPSPGFYSNYGIALINQETAVSATTFKDWNSATQREFIAGQTSDRSSMFNIMNGPRGSGGLAGKFGRIGIPPGGPFMNVMLSPNFDRVYNLDTLTKQDLATMPRVDQEALLALRGYGASGNVLADPTSATSLYATLIGPRFGEIMLNDTSLEGAKTLLAAKRMLIQNPVDDKGNALTDQMPEADKKVFLDQLDNLQTRLDSTGILFKADFNEALQGIMARYERANAYRPRAVPAGTNVFLTPSGNGFEANAIPTSARSSEYNRTSNRYDWTIEDGYTSMMANERKILAQDNLRLKPSTAMALGGKQLDAPSLIYLFQLSYNLKDEAINNQATEEINQLNALLRSYSAMQARVNEVLASFPADAKPTDTRSLALTDGPGDISPIDSNLALFLMFDKEGARPHPVEERKGIHRQTLDLLTIVEGNANTRGSLKAPAHNKNVWDQFATRLSDAVTQLNQETQIRMNEINSLDKQKNRHFELANNALAKLNEIIQGVGRAVA